MPELIWYGKEYVLDYHRRVPIQQLVPGPDLSVTPTGDDGHTLIHGDALHVGRALLPQFRGRIKMCYIDPPYNIANISTKDGSKGGDWTYDDSVGTPEMQKELRGLVGDEDLNKNDKWLLMMYPRLQVIRELLADDGIIFVSIDEHMHEYLALLMDEVFGRKNRLGDIIWKKNTGQQSDFISWTHEYVLAFAKDKTKIGSLRMAKPGAADILALVEAARAKGLTPPEAQIELRALLQTHKTDPEYKGVRNYRHIDATYRVYRTGDMSWPGGGGPTYDVLHPVTGRPCAVPSRGWGCVEETMRQWIADGLVVFGSDESAVPQRKRYLEGDIEQQPLSSIVEDNRTGSSEVSKLLGRKSLVYPKPSTLIQRFVELCTSDDDIILDLFAGTGTTGHAVMAQNKADGGHRRFILGEYDYALAHPTNTPFNEIIRPITIPRLRAAASKLGIELHLSGYRLGEPYLAPVPAYAEVLDVNPALSFEDLAQFIVGMHYGQAPVEMDPATGYLGNFADGDAGRPHFLLQPPMPLGIDQLDKLRGAVVYAVKSEADQMSLQDFGIELRQLPLCIQ